MSCSGFGFRDSELRVPCILVSGHFKQASDFGELRYLSVLVIIVIVVMVTIVRIVLGLKNLRFGSCCHFVLATVLSYLARKSRAFRRLAAGFLP